MSENRDDLLRNYLERITALRSHRDGELTATDLQTVARELGMSDDDLAAARRIAADHYERGMRYSRHGQYEDAVSELRESVALDPFNVASLCGLADALRQNGGVEERKEALQLAQRAVELEPKHDQAYRLIEELRGKRRGRTGESESREATRRERMERQTLSEKSVTSPAVIIIGLSLAAVIAFVVLLPGEGDGEGSESTTSASPGSTTTSHPQKPVQPPEPLPKPIDVTWKGAHEGFDLQLSERDRVVATEMIVGVTEGFQTSHQLTLEGRNTGTKPITELAFNFTDFNSQGKKLGENRVDVIRSGDLPLEPGATRRFPLSYPTKSTSNTYKVEVATVK